MRSRHDDDMEQVQPPCDVEPAPMPRQFGGQYIGLRPTEIQPGDTVHVTVERAQSAAEDFLARAQAMTPEERAARGIYLLGETVGVRPSLKTFAEKRVSLSEIIKGHPGENYMRERATIEGMRYDLGGFGEAIKALKSGNRVARAVWNGKGMWLRLVQGTEWGLPLLAFPEVLNHRLAPFILMKTADNQLVPWLASQTDILADDWVVVT